jgi:hypothetical protein
VGHDHRFIGVIKFEQAEVTTGEVVDLLDFRVSRRRCDWTHRLLAEVCRYIAGRGLGKDVRTAVRVVLEEVVHVDGALEAAFEEKQVHVPLIRSIIL